MTGTEFWGDPDFPELYFRLVLENDAASPDDGELYGTYIDNLRLNVACPGSVIVESELSEYHGRYCPNIEKEQLILLGYIADHSGHSRGSRVDLTLIVLDTGTELDMGGHFDLFDEISSHETSLITAK